MAVECDGLCLSGGEVGVPEYRGIAYPHPGCPLHAPGERCGCGQSRCIDCGPPPLHTKEQET